MKRLQHFMLLVIFFQPILPWCNPLAAAQTLHANCLEKCGNIEIPYPFGASDDCYLNDHFFMNCTKDAAGSPLLLLRKSSDLEVINISLDGQLKIMTFIGKDCYFINGSRDSDESKYASVTLISFPFSNTQNKLFAIGCDTQASISSGDAETGCSSKCGKQSINDIVYDGNCSGLGCCSTTIPKNYLSQDVSVISFNNHTEIWEYNPCSFVFLAENNFLNFSEGDLKNTRNISSVPTVLDWAIGNSTCENVTYTADYACRTNTKCIDSTNGPGYRCICLEGYQGNPYMLDGCQDIDECATIQPCGENKCTNTDGKFMCSCKDGYIGSAKINGGGCERVHELLKAKLPSIQIIVGVIVGFAAFFMVVSWVFWGYNKRKHLLRKQKFFEQNGGLMLQQELSEKHGHNESARIFTTNELKIATNNFDESKIIGRGGFGTVYKGILEDDKVIAIKKSKVMNHDQIEQFINEVIVLSQINHRNVVKLLGCCLETEVPLLVYEYVSKGTLHEHIHDNKKSSGALSWDNRLRIATEVAGVLAYLHLEATVCIVHRDIKCTNILLDDNHTAKVSDFGASRLVPSDKDTLTTMVQGTIGYLDPEYLHTSQLTEKSDVYSFGVVLIELLTGKKVFAFDRPEEERCLANLFIMSMKNDKMFSVLEEGLANDGNKAQIEEVGKLALACIRVCGDDRPSMRQVASELQKLLSVGKHPWNEETTHQRENDHLLGIQVAGDLYPYTYSYDSNNRSTVRCYDEPIRDNVVLLGSGV